MPALITLPALGCLCHRKPCHSIRWCITHNTWVNHRQDLNITTAKKPLFPGPGSTHSKQYRNLPRSLYCRPGDHSGTGRQCKGITGSGSITGSARRLSGQTYACVAAVSLSPECSTAGAGIYGLAERYFTGIYGLTAHQGRSQWCTGLRVVKGLCIA